MPRNTLIKTLGQKAGEMAQLLALDDLLEVLNLFPRTHRATCNSDISGSNAF